MRTTEFIALQTAIDKAGGPTKLALALKCSKQAVAKWTRTPGDRVIAIEGITGVTRQALRPDLYPPQKPKGGKNGAKTKSGHR